MAKKIKDPGFGLFGTSAAKKYLTSNGATTVVHINKKWNFSDTYFELIEMSWLRFFLYVLLGYVGLNTFFGVIYMMIGIEQITESSGHWFFDFLNGFFFSAQTVTTVGYGGISPRGLTANIIASLQALVGLMSFSFITGLLYGRFSRPSPSIRFSDNLVFRDHKGKKALMFRLMNHRTNIMLRPKVKVSTGISNKQADGEIRRSYYELSLEREQISALPTIWTVVHEITEESPFYGMDAAQIKTLVGEIYILLEYYDDAYAQDVIKMHSYQFGQVICNKKFVRAFEYNEQGYIELDHNNLNRMEDVEINAN